MIAHSATTLAVVAGGQGRRMGTPKHQLTVNGVPMLRHLVERLSWPGPTLLVLAEDSTEPPGSEYFQRITHDRGPGAGPLRGIATAIEDSSTTALIAIPVDMPGVERLQLAWLVDAINQHHALNGILLSRGPEIIEPFPAIFRSGAAPSLRTLLASGRLALRGLAEHPQFAAIPAPENWPASTWINLNEPKDLPGGITIKSARGSSPT